MPSNSFKIRVMSRQQVPIAIEWAAIEGWNPGLHDAECFYNADPKGFLIGLLDDEPIAIISAVKYSENFGFLGFLYCKERIPWQRLRHADVECRYGLP